MCVCVCDSWMHEWTKPILVSSQTLNVSQSFSQTVSGLRWYVVCTTINSLAATYTQTHSFAAVVPTHQKHHFGGLLMCHCVHNRTYMVMLEHTQSMLAQFFERKTERERKKIAKLPLHTHMRTDVSVNDQQLARMVDSFVSTLFICWLFRILCHSNESRRDFPVHCHLQLHPVQLQHSTHTLYGAPCVR